MILYKKLTAKPNKFSVSTEVPETSVKICFYHHFCFYQT